MFIFAWLAVGVCAGFGVGQLVNRSGQSLLFDCLLGVIGAICGGWAFHRLFGGSSMTQITTFGVGACAIGAVIAVLIYHELFASRAR
jgi:uncharacterized membrane protein YeaQ/YmgE (transglycosylase-associated protein family)